MKDIEITLEEIIKAMNFISLCSITQSLDAETMNIFARLLKYYTLNHPEIITQLPAKMGVTRRS